MNPALWAWKRLTCRHQVADMFKRDLRDEAEKLGARPGYTCPNCGAWVKL